MHIQPPSGAVSDAVFNFTIIRHFYPQVLCLILCTQNRGHSSNKRKSIFCFLALFSMPSKSLFIVCSSNSATKSDVLPTHLIFWVKEGWFYRLGAAAQSAQGWKPPLIVGISFETPITVLLAHLALLTCSGSGTPYTAVNAQHSCKPSTRVTGQAPRNRGAQSWRPRTENLNYEPNHTKHTDMCLMQRNTKPMIFCCSRWKPGTGERQPQNLCTWGRKLPRASPRERRSGGVHVNLCNFPDAQERVAEEASPSPHNPETRTPNSVLRIFLKDMDEFSIKFQREEEKEEDSGVRSCG